MNHKLAALLTGTAAAGTEPMVKSLELTEVDPILVGEREVKSYPIGAAGLQTTTELFLLSTTKRVAAE